MKMMTCNRIKITAALVAVCCLFSCNDKKGAKRETDVDGSEITDTALPVKEYDNNETDIPDSCLEFGYTKYSDFTEGAYGVLGIGKCKDKNIVIPAVYNGKRVECIHSEAFKNVPRLKASCCLKV